MFILHHVFSENLHLHNSNRFFRRTDLSSLYSTQPFSFVLVELALDSCLSLLIFTPPDWLNTRPVLLTIIGECPVSLYRNEM